MARMALPQGMVLSLLVALAGSSSAAAEDGGKLTIVKPIPFAEGVLVRDKVRDECKLQTKVPEFVAEYAKENIDDIVFSESVPETAAGKVLRVEITDVTETGNIWLGRSGAVGIRAELREDGKVIGTFRSRRATTGGAFGGYKGRCAFLGRCTKTLGKDIANWLQNPVMDAVGSTN